MSRVAVMAEDAQRRERIASTLTLLGSPACAAGSSVGELPAGDAAPDVVLIGLEQARSADAKAVDEVRERLPDAHLLVILPGKTSRDRRALSIGADGIVYESELDQVLAPALAALASGLAVLPRELNAGRLTPTLSSREKQALAMVVMGLTNGEIAAKLYLAESTVKSHLSTAFRKLGVSSRKDAAARILDPDSGLGPGILSISANGPAPMAVSPPDRNGSVAA
jgi:DNA-binding NarL/FixJ family response regulator